jgi:hypothetical protein
MFSFESGPDFETVSSASELLGDTLNIRDNDNARIIVPEGRLLFLGFIMESTNSCAYSLSIRSCLTLLISLLKSFRSRM